MEIIYLESFDENIKPENDKPYEKVVIRKPRLPKVAKVERFKQVGHRKWATVYHVRDELSKIVYSHEILCNAVEKAKELVREL